MPETIELRVRFDGYVIAPGWFRALADPDDAEALRAELVSAVTRHGRAQQDLGRYRMEVRSLDGTRHPDFTATPERP